MDGETFDYQSEFHQADANFNWFQERSPKNQNFRPHSLQSKRIVFSSVRIRQQHRYWGPQAAAKGHFIKVARTTSFKSQHIHEHLLHHQLAKSRSFQVTFRPANSIDDRASIFWLPWLVWNHISGECRNLPRDIHLVYRILNAQT